MVLLTPLQLGKLLAGASGIIVNSHNGALPERNLSHMADYALSGRCRIANTRNRVCRFAQDSTDFALNRATAAPFTGIIHFRICTMD